MNISLEDIYNKLVAIEEKQDTFQSTLNELKTAQRITDDYVEQLKSENKILKETIGILEKKERKNNIIIFGLKINNNLLAETVEFVNSSLQVDLQEKEVNNIFYIGKTNANRHIKLQLTSFIRKIQILRNAHKLKDKKIYVASDLTKEERDVNILLKKHQKKARDQKLETYIKNNILYIEKEEYTVEKLLAIENQVDVDAASQKNRVGVAQKSQIEVENVANSPGATRKQKTITASQKSEKKADYTYITRHNQKTNSFK